MAAEYKIHFTAEKYSIYLHCRNTMRKLVPKSAIILLLLFWNKTFSFSLSL
jgi:hypothetical protein